MMSDLEKEEADSQSFVVLHRGEKEVSSSIYENITQDLKEIMPNEVYLPTSFKRKVSERQPKVWVKRTPFESNPAIIVQIEEWLDTVGTRDFAVDVKLGIMYAIKGYKWERMTEKAEIRSESVQEGTPVIGPIGGSIETPTSKEPIPLAESTRKDGPIYINTPIEEKSKDAKPPERKSKQRPGPQYTKPIETPKRKLTFQEEDEDAAEIQKEIEEVQRAEKALTIEREKMERERIEILKKQQEATKERLVAMRQQRKRLEESIAQMGKEMAQDSQISYKDRLTRRQNLENEYGNQIERESQMVQDFIDLLDKKEEMTMDTMTTDSALSSTADPIEFMDVATVMKIKIKHMRAMECKNRSLKMYKHFIKKAKELKNTKEQEELENLLLASIKSLDRKLVKYKRALDSYDEREQLYFTTLAKNSQESEENRQREEEANLRKRHLEVRKELAKMQNEAKMAEERKKAMEAKVKEEKVKQIDKLQKLAEEQERLQRLQKQKAEEALTAAFLLKEKKQQAAEEERLTKEFLKKEKEKEELKQKKLTEQFLEQERIKEEKKQRQLTEQLLERERLEKERMQKNKTAKYTKTSRISPARPDFKRKATKPTTTEQEVKRQKLFSALNDVVLNGKKPGKGKDLRWDYEKDKKAQAIFGKIKKHNREPVDMCPKCGTLQHEGQCPCTMCGKRGHDEKSCPSQSPPTKKRKEKSEKKKGVCTCCNSEEHRAQECPWNKTESMEHEPIVPEFENLRPTICTHCRALDHLIEDCPSLKSADERRREVQCGRCGKMGHDITACLDETQLKKEREMEEALKQKQKELERINKRMRDLRQSNDKVDEPIDKDTNFPPTHKKKIPSKRGASGPPPGRERDESPQGPRQPPGRESGALGGGPPDDPRGSDDGDDGDDEDDEEEEETDEEDEEMSEVSELSDLSGFLYDMRGRRIDVEEMFEEWQRDRENRPPLRIVRGPRGHRGARGKQGKKGARGNTGPAGSFIDSGISTGNVNLDTPGLEESFKELANSMRDVWNIQKNLNTTMKDHIQIATQANKKNTEALERLNESTRQRDHDHMFMSIEVYDGTDPKKFEPWIEQIEIACRISGRDPRVVALTKSTGAITEVIRSMRPGLTWPEFKNELKSCFSESKSIVHAAAIFDSFRKQEDNENLRSYIHKYTKLHREATKRSSEDEYDTQAKLHFLSRLRNSNIASKISQSAEFEKYETFSLQKCMEKALILESRLQVREMVTQAREAVDSKTPEVMEIDAKPIEEEINTIPEDKPPNRSKANCICYKYGGYGHYGKECTAEDKDLEEFADRIVGRIEHSFQAYTPVTLQYMNDIIAKAAKLDQSRRIAKTKAKLLQGILNQRGGTQGVPRLVGRGRGRGVLKPHIEPQPQAQNQAPAVGRGRGRGGANFVAKKARQPNIPPPQSAQMQLMLHQLPLFHNLLIL